MQLTFWALLSAYVSLLYCAELQAADPLSTLPSGLRSGIGTKPIDSATVERLSGVLDGLKKNVILENTRAERDVELFRQNAPGVVLVLTKTSLGSGAIIDSAGRIITNSHVIGGGEQDVWVALKPKDSVELSKDLIFKATVEKVDAIADLALLRMNAAGKSLVTLRLGNIADLAVGQDVHAIGHPQGEVWTYTKGIISQIRDNYEWPGDNGITHRAKVIQTQTPINPGNSGGPLLDTPGRLIGINSFFRKGSEGLNYAIAVDELQKFIQRPVGRPARQDTTDSTHGGFSCPESYQTRGFSWPDILGCYNNRQSPPPNAWIVFAAPKSVRYMAVNTFPGGMIDTLITNADPNWQSFVYGFDTNCDGTIDIVAQSRNRKPDPETYRTPDRLLRLPGLATELDIALKMQRIPYPQLKVCQ